VSDLRAAVDSSDIKENDKQVMFLFIERVDMFIQDLVSQLKAQPQIFTVNPDLYPEAVEGAKAGDIAVFENQYGDVEIVRFK
jgi:hypothetical protein